MDLACIGAGTPRDGSCHVDRDRRPSLPSSVERAPVAKRAAYNTHVAVRSDGNECAIGRNCGANCFFLLQRVYSSRAVPSERIAYEVVLFRSSIYSPGYTIGRSDYSQDGNGNALYRQLAFSPGTRPCALPGSPGGSPRGRGTRVSLECYLRDRTGSACDQLQPVYSVCVAIHSPPKARLRLLTRVTGVSSTNTEQFRRRKERPLPIR